MKQRKSIEMNKVIGTRICAQIYQLRLFFLKLRGIYLCCVLITLFFLCGYIFRRPDIIYGICDYFHGREPVEIEFYQGDFWHQDTLDAQLVNVVTEGTVSFHYDLLLVNDEFPLGEDLKKFLVPYMDTVFCVNEGVEGSLSSLFIQAEQDTGEKLGITSSYRTKEKQALLYSENSSLAARPGNSEHETGLAIDLLANEYAQRYFVKTKVGRWVNENCYHYGFIIRYPFRKEKITGFEYEPWHIRYVGLPHSEIIYRNRLTLEEYLKNLQTGVYYRYFDYVFGAFDSLNQITFPSGTAEVSISPDNMGRYIVTCKRRFAVMMSIP